MIGTSSVVYPAAMFAPQVSSRGVPVAEFNIETTPHTFDFGYHFQGINIFFIYLAMLLGQSSKSVPEALAGILKNEVED